MMNFIEIDPVASEKKIFEVFYINIEGKCVCVEVLGPS